MFSGLIEDLGQVLGVTRLKQAFRLRLSCPQAFLDKCSIGASIAVNGCCLSLVAKAKAKRGQGQTQAQVSQGQVSQVGAFDVSAHTAATTIPLARGEIVNLEAAIRAGDPIGGHIVTGHVDGIALLNGRSENGANVAFDLIAPAGCESFLAARGSVALNGVSLTVVKAKGRTFAVEFIPHTLRATNLKHLAKGDACNFEADCLARYAAAAVNAKMHSLQGRKP